MLGAAESALSTACEYAASRHQFGQPIGRFQAVRHILAAARTDCAAIEALIDQAVALGTSAPAGFDQVVKAVAGRNSRRACQNSLQTLGAIGFTLEHHHHRWHLRVLALDAMLGSAAHLAAEMAETV